MRHRLRTTTEMGRVRGTTQRLEDSANLQVVQGKAHASLVNSQMIRKAPPTGTIPSISFQKKVVKRSEKITRMRTLMENQLTGKTRRSLMNMMMKLAKMRRKLKKRKVQIRKMMKFLRESRQKEMKRSMIIKITIIKKKMMNMRLKNLSKT